MPLNLLRFRDQGEAAPTLAGATARRWLTLVVLCLVQFVLVMSDTVVNVALPTIRDQLGFNTASLAWVVNAYFIAFGGLLLLFGRVADLVGRRRLFLAGVTLFALASMTCGLAQEPWQLVAGRFAQGTGAAMASPAALALITLLFPGGAERAKALSIWGSVAAIGGTSGLVISGALTGLASWRWIFLINLPVGVVVLMLIPRFVAESRADRSARLDVPGAVLGTGALLCLVYGLLQAAESGWGTSAAGVPLVLAAIMAIGFVVVEARTSEPLVPWSLVSAPIRAAGNGTNLVVSAAFFPVSFLLMLHLQTVLGYDPLTAGVAFLPYGAGVLAGVALAVHIVPRLGVRWTLVTSLLLAASGLLLLMGVSPTDRYLTDVLPGMLLATFGMGLSFPTMTIAALTGTTEQDAGLGSAVLNAGSQVGGAVGVALLVGLTARRSQISADGDDALLAFTDGFSLAVTVAAASVAVTAVGVAVLLKQPRVRPGSGLAQLDHRHRQQDH